MAWSWLWSSVPVVHCWTFRNYSKTIFPFHTSIYIYMYKTTNWRLYPMKCITNWLTVITRRFFLLLLPSMMCRTVEQEAKWNPFFNLWTEKQIMNIRTIGNCFLFKHPQATNNQHEFNNEESFSNMNLLFVISFSENLFGNICSLQGRHPETLQKCNLCQLYLFRSFAEWTMFDSYFVLRIVSSY